MSKSDQKTAMKQSLARLEKKFGSGIAVQMGSKKIEPIEVFSSGSISIDLAIGDGGVNCGLPWGRAMEIFGPECVDQDTHIHFAVWRKDGERVNHKGGTIKRLYERFHGIMGYGAGGHQRPSTIGAYFTAPSVNECGRIVHNSIEDVVYAGKKQCFRLVTEEGFGVITSGDHEFMVGNSKFRRLAGLSVGDAVFVHDNTPYRGRVERGERPDVYVKAHGVAGKKVVVCNGIKYTYYRLRKSRAVAEAKMNKLSFDEYIACLNSGNLDGLNFLPRSVHVHHKDENFRNDDPVNLQEIDPSSHSKIHAKENHNNLRFTSRPQRIVSIEPVGWRETYDLKMAAPYRNYVANNFVVHNSGGKTTIALMIVASVQRLGKLAVYVDAEHALDPVYAGKLGVNMKDLVVCQPDYGEQGLEVAGEFISSGAASIIVIDSVAALVPKSELEGEMGDSHVGLQPRMMGQFCRKYTGSTNRHNALVVFINQIREKIGVTWGSNETTPGGRAIKFGSSLRLDVRRIATLKDGDRAVGNRTRVKVIKNKIAKPFKEAEFDIIFGEGVSRSGEIVDLGAKYAVIEKSGAWYNYNGERIGQGREQAKAFIKANSEIAEKIERDIYQRAALDVI